MSEEIERTEKVELNLEESGWLCHLLMREIGPYFMGHKKFGASGSAIFTANVERAVYERQLRLYEKLADANDRIMGKKP